MFIMKSERSNVTGLSFEVNAVRAAELSYSLNKAFNWYTV